jgi:uncharacterized membrane protein
MRISRTENRILMSRARESLRGLWGLGVGVTAFFLVVMVLFQFVVPAGGLIFLFLQGVLYFGVYGLFLAVARGHEVAFKDVFHGFRRYGTVLGMSMLLGLLLIGWMWMLMTPALIVLLQYYDFLTLRADLMSGMYTGLWMALLTFFAWTALLIVPTTAVLMTYSLAYIVLADRPDLGATGSIKEAWRLTRGNKWKFFCLQMRLLGWSLLTLLTLGIGYLWLMPYAFVSMAHFYLDAKGETLDGALISDAVLA